MNEKNTPEPNPYAAPETWSPAQRQKYGAPPEPKVDLRRVSLETWTYLYDAADNEIAPGQNLNEALDRIRAEATAGPVLPGCSFCESCGSPSHRVAVGDHNPGCKATEQPPLRTRAAVDEEIATVILERAVVETALAWLQSEPASLGKNEGIMVLALRRLEARRAARKETET